MVRAEIDTQLFSQFSEQMQELPSIELSQKPTENVVSADAKTTIELAKLRTQIKKLEKQLSVRTDEKKLMQLNQLQQQLTTLQEHH